MLTVIQKFAEHEVGAIITDADKVAAVLQSEFARFVVRTAPDPVAAPAPTLVGPRED